MFDAHVIRVLIASPSDTRAMRDGVERSLHGWNGERAESSRVVLLPRRWETDAVPELTGPDGQTVINRQLVDDADIVVVVFHQTLGSATARAASGTAEELARAREGGKPVHVYFSAMPVDRDHDREQLAALDQFRDSVKTLGLYGSFDSPGDLEAQVRRAIEHDISKLNLSVTAVRSNAGASLAGQYKYRRELDSKGRMRTKGERLEITNSGGVAAENVSVSLASLEKDLQAPMLMADNGPFTIAPNGGAYSVPVLMYAGTARRVQANYRWYEDGVEKFSAHTVSFT